MLLAEYKSGNTLGGYAKVYNFTPFLKGLSDLGIIDESPCIRIVPLFLFFTDKYEIVSTHNADEGTNRVSECVLLWIPFAIHVIKVMQCQMIREASKYLKEVSCA